MWIIIPESNELIYQEVQKNHDWAIVIIVGVIAIPLWYGFVQQIIFGKLFGDRPAPDSVLIIFWFIFGILIPVGFLFARLTVLVKNDGLYLKLLPFHFRYRKWALKDIVSYYDVVYDPIRQFGGWGIRINSRGEWAYNIGGSKALELHLKSGKVIVIGTNQPQNLIEALDQAKNQ